MSVWQATAGKRKRRTEARPSVMQGDDAQDSKRIKVEQCSEEVTSGSECTELIAMRNHAELVGLVYRGTYPSIRRTCAIEKFARAAYFALSGDNDRLIDLTSHATRHFEQWDIDDFNQHIDRIGFYDRCSRWQRRDISRKRLKPQKVLTTEVRAKRNSSAGDESMPTVVRSPGGDGESLTTVKTEPLVARNQKVETSRRSQKKKKKPVTALRAIPRQQNTSNHAKYT